MSIIALAVITGLIAFGAFEEIPKSPWLYAVFGLSLAAIVEASNDHN